MSDNIDKNNINDLNSEMTDYDFFSKRIPSRTYVSKRLKNKRMDGTERSLRIISKVVDGKIDIQHEKLRLQNEVILRITDGCRQQIVAKIYEDTKGIFILSIQRYKINGVPMQNHFTFLGHEIKTLKNFLESLPFLDFSEPGKTRYEDDELIKLKAEFSKNSDLLREALKNNVTKTDIVSLGYRKTQLRLFSDLLEKKEIFSTKKSEWKKAKDEDVWQYFFEKNPWIFGYGLNFSYNEPVNKNKLEQVIKGFDIKGRGKKIDALLKTRGIVNSICLVEIKKPETLLLKSLKNSYRPECWQLSDELNGGISQSQKNCQKTVENIGVKLEVKEDDGSPTGETIFSYLPKSYLIIGNLKQFEAENGINEDKYSSFELFRKNIINPEIITFDELFERARFIVEANERSI